MLETGPDAAVTRPARSAVDLIQQLWAAGEPIRLAINGKFGLLVSDVTSCEQLLDLVDRLETIEAIRDGLASIDRGEGRPADEVLEELRQKYNTPADT